MKVHSPIPLPFPKATAEVVAHYIVAAGHDIGAAGHDIGATGHPTDRTLVRLNGSEFARLVAAQVTHVASLVEARCSDFSCILASGDPVEVAITALATWRLGGRVILPPNLRPATLAHLIAKLETSGSKIIAPSPALHLSTLEVVGEIDDVETTSSRAYEVDSSATILTCYTSGTTGEPEAAHKTAGQLLGEARLLASLYMTKPGRGVVCSVPSHHLYGFLLGVLAPLYGEQVLVGGSGPERASLRSLSVGLLQAQLVSVPAHLQSLLTTERELLASYHCYFSSSAPLPQDVGDELLALSENAQLIEIFGSSETGGIAVRENSPGGAWRPLPGLRVAADEKQLLTLNSPFTNGGVEVTITTSDQIEILPEGFRHLGRKDGVVKIGGKRISLQDLEARVLEQAEVREVACVILPSPGLRHQEIGMVLVPTEKPANELLFKQKVRTQLREHFDEVVIPRRIRLAETLPRSTTGKLERSTLTDLFESRSAPLETRSANTNRDTLLEGFADFRVTSDLANLNTEGAHLEYEVRLSNSQVWFQGHFPQFAVLPGVVQLHSLVLECTRHFWPQFENLRSQRQIKFKRPLVPGDTLRVRLCPATEPMRLSFNIEWLGNPASSELGPIPAASGVLYFDA